MARVPEPARTTLGKMRAVIRSVVPAETSEVISYQMPAFRYKGGLVCYGAFSNHCSLFPMNKSLIKTFREELKGFDAVEGTIRFPLDKPLPAALVKKLIKARVAENDLKKKR